MIIFDLLSFSILCMCNAVNFDYQYKTNEKIQWYKDLSTFACHYAQLIILICCLPDNGKQWRSLENLMLECKIIDNKIYFLQLNLSKHYKL